MGTKATASLLRGAGLLWLAVFALASLTKGCAIDNRQFPGGDAGFVTTEVDPLFGTCVPDTPCIASNPCHKGAVVCSASGLATCQDTLLLQANGSVCDDGATCRDGNCEVCAAGKPCAVPNSPCRIGVVECSTGAAVCVESNNQTNGVGCGDGRVCQNGACIKCVDGAACTPGNACHQGSLRCSDGFCQDTGTALGPGSACGDQSVCDASGACLQCSAGSECGIPENPCRVGTVACNTGATLCIESGNAPDGAGCGVGSICSGGVCVTCSDGVSCVPANPCHVGQTSCSATELCTDTGTSLQNGTACGTEKVCSGGVCSACADGEPCQADDPCKRGTVSCASGVSLCVAAENQPDGTPCGDGTVCSDGVCSACNAGARCVPATSACHTGALDCSTGAASCADDGGTLADGTTCGANLVCRGGQCFSCRVGTTCQPDNACATGSFSCSTGAEVCTVTGNKAPGTACGTGRVCDATGNCVACGEGQACAPANPCHTGSLSCATVPPQCSDSGVSQPDGTSCGKNLTCSGGRCSPCTAGLSCTPSNPCHNGTTSCSSGASQCTDTGNKAAGASCGNGRVCSASGECVSCVAGASCTPSNPCHQGSFSCASGAQVCVDSGAPATDGTNCGQNLFCRSGMCAVCAANQSCQPANACRTGSTSCGTGSSLCLETGNQPSGNSCGAAQSCRNGTKTAAATCNGNGQCAIPVPAACPNGCNAAGTDCLTCGTGQVACGGNCCAAGQGCCSNVCVNLNSSANCGACGNVCDGCTNGRCPALWDALTSTWDTAVWN